MSVIDAIVKNTRHRVAQRKANRPVSELHSLIKSAPTPRSLFSALSQGFTVIAEHKRKSPSGGASDPDNLRDAYATYADTPWISAVSVLTDEDYFGGHLEDLAVARERVKKPVLRKDFIVDPYQVLEARAFGADAILLMASVLADDPSLMRSLYELARSLDLDVLVELGMTERRIEDLVRVVPPEARIWGINARQFAKRGGQASAGFDPSARHDLPTDTAQHRTFRGLVPAGKLAVAESGIHSALELEAAKLDGYAAALVGTAFLSTDRRIADVVQDLGRTFRGIRPHRKSPRRAAAFAEVSAEIP